MLKTTFLIVLFIGSVTFVQSQSLPKDTSTHGLDTLGLNDSDIDDLLNDLDLFLDSLLKPRSYVLINVSANQGYFNFTNKGNNRLKQVEKWIWSPTLGYYDKAGPGITAASYMIRDSSQRYFYQLAITPSYDYLRDKRLATGISYTRFFTRNALPFYTSPLQSEMSAYFLWRKSWIQPGIAFSYGWGSRTEFNKREVIYRRLLASAANEGLIGSVDTVSVLTRNRRSILDFSTTFSLRHDFYWLDVISKKDHIRLSPILSLAAGTQRFGFNQSNSALGNLRAVALSNNRSVSLKQDFELLSFTGYLRGEYSYGKFFIQPQLLLDYYFPADQNQLSVLFSMNFGFML